MKKPVIAVDIDEVLSPLHDLVIAHHNAVYGTNYPLEDPQGRYYLDEFTGDDSELSIKKLRTFVETHEFKSVAPLEGAVRVIADLSKRFELVVITARQDFYVEFTHQWLEKHFPQAFASVHFTDFSTGHLLKTPKSEICKQLGASYLIDDNLHNIMDVANAGLQAILFGEYPWNRVSTLPNSVIRCKDWQSVKEYFDGRS